MLGPHVWQQGAKKTVTEAHIDISHYQGLTAAEERQIESTANAIIRKRAPVSTRVMHKSQAEKEFGFRIYQGGAIPGDELRIVDIAGVDTEACCGTHCENTGAVGMIKILRSSRVSDGIVRISFVAGDRAYQEMNAQAGIISDLCTMWGVEQSLVFKTAERFFRDYKHLSSQLRDQDRTILDLQVRGLVARKDARLALVASTQSDPTLYFSQLGKYAGKLKVLIRKPWCRNLAKAWPSWGTSS